MTQVHCYADLIGTAFEF